MVGPAYFWIDPLEQFIGLIRKRCEPTALLDN